jgi:thiol-disulfide isomerase/thioredoxin
MMRNTMRTFAVMALSVLAGPVLAAVNVGDKPTLNMQSADGRGQVSLDQFKGKIVVVDFWATWCGPCMAEAGHMVQIHKTYGPKGLQMIGVSLDDAPAPMLQVAREKGFEWPQAIDLGGQVSNQWGVSGIPCTFIISPKGQVLWRGHPAQIDPQIERAFQTNPPQLVDPKVLAEATAALDKIEASLKENAHAEAVRSLANVPASARADPKVAQRLAEVEKQVNEYAEKTIAEVDPLIQDKKFVEAGTKLSELARGLGNTPAGVNARKKLTEMMAIPGAKAQFEAAQRARTAQDELLIAQRLKGEGKKEQAYVRFKSIVTNFGGTPAATEAKAAVDEFERDAKFVQRAKDMAAEGKAKSLLSLAENYKRAGRSDLARDKYLEVTRQFPGTTYAAQAEQAIRELQARK